MAFRSASSPARRATLPCAVGLTPVARASLGCCLSSALLAGALPAQAQGTTAQASLAPVVITSQAARAAVAGFGDVGLQQLPMQASVIGNVALADRDVQRLADVVALKASVSDAYNAVGYWDTVAIRGLAIDNRRNIKRDGLPINGETSLPLDNKERVEILEGLSGVQAGLSAPGGLVNLVVKRPDTSLRSATLGWEQSGSRLAAADLSQRFGSAGEPQAFGLRVNLVAQHLDPQLRSATGHRELAAVAADWRVSADTLVEVELESSRRSQPSQPGFSLQGNHLPDARAIDPRINLNNQPWSLPVVLAGHTGSLRVTQAVGPGWKFTGHYVHQELRSDDRLAFPFGCDAAGQYDRYCRDGSFDYYPFQSDGEHRRSDALQLGLDGQFQTGALRHVLNVGWLASQYSLHVNARLDDGFYPPIGQGTIDGNTVVPMPNVGLIPNTGRAERTSELFARDRVVLAADWTAWLGLRATHLRQSAIRTDGNQGIAYAQSFATPWLALSHELGAGRQVYASWGQGIETTYTPNKAAYGDSAGQPLPALRSRQFELGYKARTADDTLSGSAAYFNIHQPNVSDSGSSLVIDGQQRRQGVQGDLSWTMDRWRIEGGAMLLDAKLHGASVNDGLRPTNVPAQTLKAQLSYRVSGMTGLQLGGALVYEGDRMVLSDNSISIPAWTRIDLSLKHQQRWDGGALLTWRVGVYNVADQRAWRESPFQFGHSYLYPLAPRTWRISVQADL
jgi:iron complex outermembrane receptor protein